MPKKTETLNLGGFEYTRAELQKMMRDARKADEPHDGEPQNKKWNEQQERNADDRHNQHDNQNHQNRDEKKLGQQPNRAGLQGLRRREG